MKYVTVFCSAQDVAEAYVRDAREFATLLAKRGYGLVWGGSGTGLMHTIAQSAKDAGGRVVGVTIPRLKEVAMRDANEMIVTQTIAERKATMLERSDAIALLPGGIGTLDEITDVLEHKKHSHRAKPIVVLNTNNFFEGFRTQLKRMQDEGFIETPLDDLILFAHTPQDAVEAITTQLEKQRE